MSVAAKTPQRADFKRAKRRASEVRKENFVREPPVRIYEIARNYHLRVVEADFASGKFVGVSGLLDLKESKIVLERSDSPARKRFTTAHELRHFLLHKKHLEKEPDLGILLRRPLGHADSDAREQEANCFAANLLVPNVLLVKYRDHSDDLLARLFGVSLEMIGYRLQTP